MDSVSSRIRYLLAGALCVAAAGCMVDPGEPGEGSEESDVADENASMAEATEEITNSPSDVIACGGITTYCLARCSKTGDTLHIVGPITQIPYGSCIAKGEEFCLSKKLGYRTHSCWGHL